MPRFYIDTDDGVSYCVDEEGAIYIDLRSAQQEALYALPELVRSRLSTNGPLVISAIVRDEIGAVVAKASVRLVIDIAATPS